MANDETDTGAVLMPIEQRTIVLTPEGDDEVLAARTESSEIYLPIRPICSALGVSWTTQYRKIRADEVLWERVRTLRLQTRGGPQNLVCMEVEAIPLWLASIEPGRVRADLRERLTSYKRWVRKVVYEAFARETGIPDALSSPRSPVSSTPDVAALRNIEQMALAIATMARQQIAFEEHVESRFSVLEANVVERHEAVTGRLDHAAAVVGSLLRRVDAIEGVVAPGALISDAQAAEISALVKAIATAMAERAKETGTTTRNPYQAVFGELYRRFRVSSYHNVPQRRFEEVMTWLREYQETYKVRPGSELPPEG